MQATDSLETLMYTKPGQAEKILLKKKPLLRECQTFEFTHLHVKLLILVGVPLIKDMVLHQFYLGTIIRVG